MCWEHGQELVMLPGCPEWRSGLDWLVPVSSQVGKYLLLCGAAGSKAQSFSVVLDGVTCPSWPGPPLTPWQIPVTNPYLPPLLPSSHAYPEVPEMSQKQTGCHDRVAEKLGSFGGCRRQLSLLSPGQQAGVGLSPPASPGPFLLAHTRVHISLLLSHKVQAQSQVYCFYLVYFKYSFTLYYML